MISRNDRINEKNRNIKNISVFKGKDWIDSLDLIGNLAVFGGEEKKRINLLLRCIAKCYGKKGIIVIHNDNNLVKELRKFHAYYYDLCRIYGNRVKRCFIDSSNLVYEPFYGMDIPRIIEIIYGNVGMDNPSYSQLNNCAETLNKYLLLLEKNRRIIDLDALVELCGFSFNKLVNDYMGCLNNDEKEEYIASMSFNNSYIQVKNDINAFARKLDGRIWFRKLSNDKATDISIIEAINQKAILSIKIDASRGVLDYLFKEIQCIDNNENDFLLILDQTSLINSSIAINTVLFPNQLFDLVVSSNSISEIMGSEQNINLLLDKLDNTVIMNCSNTATANVYSNYIGKYMKRIEQKTYDPTKLLFKEMGNSIQYHEELFDKITPSEFVNLNGGAIIINHNQDIVKIKDFIV